MILYWGGLSVTAQSRLAQNDLSLGKRNLLAVD